MTRAYDPKVHCGAKSHSRGLPCVQWKGFRTDHPGSGHCTFHGGATPTNKKAAARERVARALDQLGQPAGTGDPFQLLSKAVQHAEGHLEAAAALVREAAAAADAQVASVTAALDLEASLEVLEVAIRDAARVGKQAVDADVADRRQAIDDRAESLLWRFVSALFERYVPDERRREAEAWAATTLSEIAGEYDQSVVH